MSSSSDLHWIIEEGSSPIVAFALHNGHDVPPHIQDTLAIDAVTRLREEDPFTAEWTEISDTRVVVNLSRFVVDLNRPREKSVYQNPEDAWGLKVRKHMLDKQELDPLLEIYDRFYIELQDFLQRLTSRHGKVVVLDLHSFNYRRNGPDAKPGNPRDNPEINVGTGTMDRDRWAPIVDAIIDDMRKFDFDGRELDVRENIKFHGANVPAWIHHTFPDQICDVALEIKKFFMDEWTGELNRETHGRIKQALSSTIPHLSNLLRIL